MALVLEAIRWLRRSLFGSGRSHVFLAYSLMVFFIGQAIGLVAGNRIGFDSPLFYAPVVLAALAYLGGVGRRESGFLTELAGLLFVLYLLYLFIGF